MVECTGLENRRGLTPTVGSNPTFSAIQAHLEDLSQMRSADGIFLCSLFSVFSASLRRSQLNGLSFDGAIAEAGHKIFLRNQEHHSYWQP